MNGTTKNEQMVALMGKAKGEDIQVKEVDALITQLRNKSKGIVIRSFKNI
jgi:hypothetical protein